MIRYYLCTILLSMAFATTFAIEKGVPQTPLSRPFTAVAKNMSIYKSTSIEGKVIGTIPTEVELSFRESNEYEHWIYIDDTKHNVHGWVLDYGGYYGDKTNRDPDNSAYQNALDYACTTLGYNPEAFKRQGYASTTCDNGETHVYSSETTWDKFLKWVIIILIGLGLLTAWMPVLPWPLKNNSFWYLAAAGVAEIIYSLHYTVFHSYGDNSLFSLFVTGLVQALALLFAFRIGRSRPEWGGWLSMAGMTTVLITISCVRGIGTMLASIAGGILNILIGCVVLVVIYAFIKDDDKSSGRSSSEDSERKEDYSCDTCHYYKNPGLSAGERYCSRGFNGGCETNCTYHSKRG